MDQAHSVNNAVHPYFSFIDEQLRQEYTRRDRLDSRGLAVVTSSSAVVAIAFALLAVIMGDDYTFGEYARSAIFAAIGLFVAAGVLAIRASANRKYDVAAPETLTRMLARSRDESDGVAKYVTAHINVGTVRSLREGNNAKTYYLTAALITQLLAVLSILAAIALEFLV